MGLLDKIEDKLSSNKNKNQDPALANEGVGTTGHTGQGSHFGSNTTGGTSGITGGTHPIVSGQGTNTGAHTGAGTHVGNTGAGNYGPGPASNTAGPHSSNLANKGDPRVDSDLDNTRGGYGSNVGGGVGGAHTGTGIGGTHSGAGNYGPGPASNTAGPHSSNLANKADPRVDSDLDNTRGGYGSNVGGTHTTGAGVGGTHTGAHTGAGNYGPGPAQNTAGPHKSDMMNKLDPRVDSDLDSSRGAHGTHTTGAAGTHGQQHADLVPGSHPAANNPSAIPTAGGERVGSIPGGNNQYDATNSRATGPGSNTAGPHNSNIMNKLDPRVDSDLDSNRNTHGTHGTTGGFGSSNTPLANDSSFNQRHGGAGVGAAGAGNYGPGPASNTAGPHSSNLANKADPRVDSDLDNARGGYGQQGYAGTTGHNTTGSGLTGSHNTTGGGLTGSSHHNTTGGGLTGSSHNTGDNRTMMEKAKDKLIPSRNDRPDDPVTGTNVGQSNVPGNTTGHTYGSGTTGADTTTGRNW